jgi:hypothetical protein
MVRTSKRKEEQMVHEDEVQGQIANQGKPPLDASLILYISYSCIITGFIKVHVFYFILSVVSATRSFINPPLGCSPR